MIYKKSAEEEIMVHRIIFLVLPGIFLTTIAAIAVASEKEKAVEKVQDE